MTRRLWRTIALLFVMTAAPGDAEACSCNESGPPCQGAFTADGVFAGRVRAVETIPASQRGVSYESVLVTLEVERPFLNASLGVVELTTGMGGGDCGYRFVAGRRYLVYARRNGSQWTASICSRTRPLEEAQEDLAYLTTMPQEAAGARVFGRVNRWHREPFEDIGVDYGPMEDIPVRVSGQAVFRDVLTDATGRFEISGLPVGRLNITITPPFGYETRYLERDFELRDRRACSVHDFQISQVASASGTVIDAQGRPLPGVQVEAVAAELAAHTPKSFQNPATTDESGRFEFDALPPGEYVFGLNLTDRTAYRGRGVATYLPGTLDLAAATVVTLKAGDQQDVGVLRLASK